MINDDYGKFLDAPYNDYSITSNGEAYSHKRGTVRRLNPILMSNGYFVISPAAKGMNTYQPQLYIHHLVAQYFIGPRPEGNYVRHLDGNKTNNNLDNLAFGTPQDNVNDTMSHGRVPKGETHYRSTLTTADVTVIVNRIKNGDVLKDIAFDFNVCPITITSIKSGRIWKHLTGGPVPSPNKWQKISSSEREIIKQRLLNGETTKDLAIEYNVSRDLINKIRRCY